MSEGPMSIDRIRLAADALRTNAEVLRECHIISTRNRAFWLTEPEDLRAKSDHDDWMKLASELERLANYLEGK